MATATKTKRATVGGRPSAGVRKKTVKKPGSAPRKKVADLTPLEKIHADPRNRRVDIPGCQELSESMAAVGLQQAIVVRPGVAEDKIPVGHYVIVFGERRYRAAMILQWESIAAEVRDIDRAAALELMAVENAQREDLNDIERGELLSRLIQPAVDGGADKTVKQAAAVIGVAESTARNLMRLLELPEPWRGRVVSGEMPSSFARGMLPIIGCKPALKNLDKRWKQMDAKEITREYFVDNVLFAMQHACRSLSEAVSYERSSVWQLTNLNDLRRRLFDVDDATRAQLGVITLTVDRKAYEFATNVKLYDQLQQAEASKLLEKLENRKQSGKAKSSSASGKKLSPAQQKKEDDRKRKEQAEILKRRVEDWRLSWLRWSIAASFEVGGWQVEKFMAWMVAYGGSTATHRHDAVAAAAGKQNASVSIRKDAHLDGPAWYAKLAEATRDTFAGGAALLRDIAAELIWPCEGGCDPHNLPAEVIESLALDLEIDLATTWSAVQGAGADQTLYRKFFELHNKEQLLALGKELDVNLFGLAAKAKMVDRFCTLPKRITLPKSIAPLKAPRAKTKRRRKS